MKDKRYLKASMKIELEYQENRNILKRRFPSKTEIEDFHFSPHKLVDDEQKIFTNEVLVLVYERMGGEYFEKAFSGGNYDFRVENQPGIDIEIHLKQPDQTLRIDMGDIARALCIKHLKPAFILPSRKYISCKIDNCQLGQDKVQAFTSDFIIELQTKVDSYIITKKEKEIKTILSVSDKKSIGGCAFCSITSGELFKCDYCGKFFCRDHLTPKIRGGMDYLITAGGHFCELYNEKQKMKSEPKKDIPKKLSIIERIRNWLLGIK